MRQKTQGDGVFELINNSILIMILIVVLYPLIFVLSASISDPNSVLRGEIWLFPKNITFYGYTKVFQNRDILLGIGNTTLYTLAGTAINLIMTIFAAYPLARKDFGGRNGFMLLFVIPMFFGGGLIPTYLLIKNLGMLDTIWVMIIPNAVAVWNIIIMRTYFQTSIPVELLEAAEIDGCTHFKVLLRVVLPLSAPIIAVISLFYAVGHWNEYFNAMIYLTDRTRFTLQLFLREILIQNEMNEMTGGLDVTVVEKLKNAETIKYAVVIVANLPLLIVYPFLQKYFVKGILIGALKG